MKLHRQLPVYSPLSLGAIVAASAQTLSLGADPRTELRELLQREYGSSTVVLCATGTQALTLAIHEALDRADANGLVALPAFSCFDIASAAIGAGVRASLYDIDPSTLGPDHESLERVLKAGVRVAVVAPLYGIPLDWAALSAIAERYGAILIEDAAQGNGARWNGQRVGSRGEIAILSFGRGKGWTGGHGGALLLKGAADSSETELASDEFGDDVSTLLGVAAQWLLGRPSIYGLPQSIPSLRLGETVYRQPQRPRCLGRAAAAAILATRDASEREAEVRRSHAQKLLSAIGDSSVLRPIRCDDLSEPGYLRLPVRMPHGLSSFADPDRALALGVAPSYPSTLGALPQLAGKLDGPEESWPGAQDLARELVTFPTHSKLDSEDLVRLFELVAKVPT